MAVVDDVRYQDKLFGNFTKETASCTANGLVKVTLKQSRILCCHDRMWKIRLMHSLWCIIRWEWQCLATYMQCHTFHEVCGDGKGLYSTIWRSVYAYCTKADNCMVMTFDRSKPYSKFKLAILRGGLSKLMSLKGSILMCTSTHRIWQHLEWFWWDTPNLLSTCSNYQ